MGRLVELDDEERALLLHALFAWQAWLLTARGRDNPLVMDDESDLLVAGVEALVVKLGGDLRAQFFTEP